MSKERDRYRQEVTAGGCICCLHDGRAREAHCTIRVAGDRWNLVPVCEEHFKEWQRNGRGFEFRYAPLAKLAEAARMDRAQQSTQGSLAL